MKQKVSFEFDLILMNKYFTLFFAIFRINV